MASGSDDLVVDQGPHAIVRLHLKVAKQDAFSNIFQHFRHDLIIAAYGDDGMTFETWRRIIIQMGRHDE